MEYGGSRSVPTPSSEESPERRRRERVRCGGGKRVLIVFSLGRVTP